MSDDDLKLSERIQQRVSRCKRCSGSGAYIEDGLELACPDCGDWLTCLRWVRELEAESAELRKLLRYVVYHRNALGEKLIEHLPEERQRKVAEALKKGGM